MSMVDLVMPKMGESIMEATILKWLKKPGDQVQQDEAVLEIATDKVDSEVPSTAAGVLSEILFQENDVVSVGSVIARISTANGSASAGGQAIEEAVHTEVPYTPQAAPLQAEPRQEKATNATTRFYSPLVLKIAQEEGISLAELERIDGTGQDGRVSKKDLLTYLANRGSGSASSPVSEPQQTTPVQPQRSSQETYQALPAPVVASAPQAYSGKVEIVEMDRMRKLIAKHMVDSKHTSPHVTSFVETDVTNMVLWREKVKKDFEKREGTKLTFTPLFVEAIVKCLKQYPWLNSSLDGDRIVIKKDINMGMATALPNGNLIVPVIKSADQLNLTGLARQVNGLADAARNNKLRPDDTQGGTFTLTNVGTFGSIMGTPIINQPQVAILAVGAIKKRPVVIETDQGDSIAIRHMMYMSMSYDHRIIDGALGATFLNAVSKALEGFDINRNY